MYLRKEILKINEMNLSEKEIIEINNGNKANAWKMINLLKSMKKIVHVDNDSEEAFILNGIKKEDLKYNPNWF